MQLVDGATAGLRSTASAPEAAVGQPLRPVMAGMRLAGKAEACRRCPEYGSEHFSLCSVRSLPGDG